MKRKAALIISLIIIVSLLSLPASADAAVDKDTFENIDEYIKNEMETGKIPGLSLGIVYGDQIIYLKGYGVSGPDKTSVTAETPFVLGSVSKSFTALAVRQLCNEGKLDYNAPVISYIPWFQSSIKAESDKITIKNLIDHKSGFSEASGTGVYLGYKYTMEELVRRLSKVKLNRAVGITREYSNTNYIILGLLIQTVSGMSYEEYIQKNIFNKLDMKNSFTSEEAALKNGLATGYKVVYGLALPTHFTYPQGNIAHGFLISSAEDMCNYMMCCLNNGYYKGTSLIPDNTLATNTSPTRSYEKGDEYYLTYWDIGNNPIGYYGHSGTTVNYTSTYSVSQQSRYGVVILTNVNNYFCKPAVIPDTIFQGVTAILEGRTPVSTGKTSFSSVGLVETALLVVAVILMIIRLYWLKFFTSTLIKGKKKKTIKLISMVAVDFVIPAVMLCITYVFFNCSISYALATIPEQVIPLYLVATLLLLTGIIKLGLLYRFNKNS